MTIESKSDQKNENKEVLKHLQNELPGENNVMNRNVI